MSRIPSLAAFCVAIALLATSASQPAEAGRWHRFGIYSSAYGPGYFHSYWNYGGRFGYRPYGSYYGYYGARPYYGYSVGGWGGYYGGWSTYRPYAYSPVYYSTSYYGTAPTSYSYVSTPAPYAYGGYGSSYVGWGCGSACGTMPVSTTAVVEPVPADATAVAAPCTSCAPTCCNAYAYTPVTYSYGWGHYRARRCCGLFGGYRGYRGWGWGLGYGYGGFGYGRGWYGW